MPTIQVAIDASGAGRGAGLFHTHARTVTKAATEVGVSTDKASKKITKMGSSLGGVAKLVGSLGIFYMFQRLARSAIGFAAEQANTLAQLRAGLESTGGVSGQTMASLQALSAEMQTLTVYSNEAVESASAIMLSFTNIADDVFPRAMKATADIATRMGTDLQGAVIQVAKALNDPVANLGALSRAGIQFSKAQKVVIKSLWETGKQAEAQRLILGELENQYGRSATGARQTLGGAMKALKNAFDDLLKSMVSEGAMAMELERIARALEEYNKKGEEGASWMLRWAQYVNKSQVVLQGLGKEYGAGREALDEWVKANARAVAALNITAVATKKASDIEEGHQGALVKTQAKIDKEIEVLYHKTQVLGLTSARTAQYYAIVAGGMKEQTDEILALHQKITAFEEIVVLEKAAADATKDFEDRTRQAREEVEEFVKTPLEKLKEQLIEIDRLHDEGVFGDPKSVQALELWSKAVTKIEGQMDELGDSMRKVADPTPWEKTADRMADSIGGAVEDIIFDFENAGETAVRMLKQIASELLQHLVIRKMVESIGGWLSGKAANGMVLDRGAMIPFDRGGIVDRPTPFPMSGGRTGVMGEAGPEGVFPLTRDKSGNLGISAEGGGSSVQNITFNIKTPDADSFRRSRGQILADIRSGASRMKG